MSESTTQAAQPKGRKILGMSQGQLLIVLGVALVGGAYLLWRARKNKAAAQQQAPAAGTCPDGSQPDANGNCVQSGQDWSGQIGTLQTEIADLQGALSGAGGGGAGTVGGSTGTTTVPGGTNLPGPSGPGGTGGTGGGGPTWTPAGAISNLQQTGQTRTSVSIRWNPANNASGGYAYKLTQLNGVVKASGTTRSTSFSAAGLHPGWEYNFGIQALPGGAGNNIHVKTSS